MTGRATQLRYDKSGAGATDGNDWGTIMGTSKGIKTHEPSDAAMACGMSFGTALIDTTILAALTGMGAGWCLAVFTGAFAVTFGALAMCRAAGRADDAMRDEMNLR